MLNKTQQHVKQWITFVTEILDEFSKIRQRQRPQANSHMLKVEFLPGTSITTAAATMMKLKQETGCEFCTSFNGVLLSTLGKVSADEIESEYERKIKDNTASPNCV